MTVRERLNRLKEAGRQQSPSLPTVTSQAAGETAGRKKLGANNCRKAGKDHIPGTGGGAPGGGAADAAGRGPAGIPEFPGCGDHRRGCGDAHRVVCRAEIPHGGGSYRARQDYDRQLAELRNRYYQEENEQQRARLAEDASMQASFARADEIRAH